MAETVQGLVDAVVNEGGFDTSSTAVTAGSVLAWLNRRHRVMVRRSRCYRYTASLGSTVVNQRDYPLPAGLVESYEVDVNGVVYGKAKHTDLANGALGYIVLSGSGGIFGAEESATGDLEVALYPTPTVAGQPITMRAAWLPPDLLTSDDTTLRVPSSYADALIAGAVATGLRRVEHRPDLAQPHEQEFADACEELRREVNRRYRGSGPAIIRVVGLNA